MKPVIALIGRPNVGKSTLFNCLTRTRNALVADQPGLTRDRNYGEGRLGDKPYLVVDTGGLVERAAEGIEALMAEQVWTAVDEADRVFFLVDGRAGLQADDRDIAARLRRAGKPVHLIVNKTEGLDETAAVLEFHSLGFGEPVAIAASHGQGVETLMADICAELPEEDIAETAEQGIRVAVIGRPNVGKSTLVNRILGEQRVLAFDQPGTTRDSIFIPFARDGVRYTLIDTAGVRRRGRVDDKLEKFSVIKSLQAIEQCDVAVLLLDAHQEVSDQDAHLLGFILEAGRALIIAVNKWDGLDDDERRQIRAQLERKLSFVDFARIHFISALHGSGVGELFASLRRAYDSATLKMNTQQLTRILEDAIAAHQPPLVRGRRIKLRYAHQGGRRPPVVVIHGNQTAEVPAAYQRYLMKAFRSALRLEGTPIRIEFKSGVNPYAHKRNVLTERQIGRRKRLMRHVKGRGK